MSNTNIHVAVKNCYNKYTESECVASIDNLKTVIQCNIKDIDVINADGFTAIHWAARYGLNDCVQVLLDFGANPNIPFVAENGTFNAMHLAMIYLRMTHNRTKAIIKALIDAGIDPNIQDDTGNTPLHYGAKQDCYNCIEHLLKNGADGKIKNNLGQTSFNLIQQHGDPECRRLVDEVVHASISHKISE